MNSGIYIFFITVVLNAVNELFKLKLRDNYIFLIDLIRFLDVTIDLLQNMHWCVMYRMHRK